MNKAEIRKRILKIRKINYHKNQKINFESLLKILKKTKIDSGVIGGYYPYNYECDTTEIFKKLGINLENLNSSLSQKIENFIDNGLSGQEAITESILSISPRLKVSL